QARRQEQLAQDAGRSERAAARHSRDLLARAQLEHGVHLLKAGDALGLLHLLEARKTASDLSQTRGSAISVWAGWAAAGEYRLAGLVSHQDAIPVIALSPDGKLLATGSLDHTARLWETDTGRPRS